MTDNIYGAKYDKGKNRLNLIDPHFEYDLGLVMTKGAEIYGEYSWKQVPNPESRYLAALKRHTNAIARGEIFDPSSGLPHAAHIAANAMFLHYFQSIKKMDEDAAQLAFDFMIDGQ